MIAEILGLIAGIAAHQTKPLIDDLDTDSQTVRNLSSYAVGYLSIGVVFEVSLLVYGMDATNRQRARAAFWRLWRAFRIAGRRKISFASDRLMAAFRSTGSATRVPIRSTSA